MRRWVKVGLETPKQHHVPAAVVLTAHQQSGACVGERPNSDLLVSLLYLLADLMQRFNQVFQCLHRAGKDSENVAGLFANLPSLVVLGACGGTGTGLGPLELT